MDRLLVDTNLLLDIADDGRPSSEEAAMLFELAADDKATCLVTASSLKDFYFIARKVMDDEIRREWIGLFADTFEVIGLGAAEVARALISDEPDFEDGLVRAAAELSGCSYIVSRDERAFVNSNVPRITAGAYISQNSAECELAKQ